MHAHRAIGKSRDPPLDVLYKKAGILSLIKFFARHVGYGARMKASGSFQSEKMDDLMSTPGLPCIMSGMGDSTLAVI